MSSKMKYFIHEKALVATKNIGKGTKIWAFCNIQKGAKIGKNCQLSDGCFMEGKAVLGDNVTLKNGVSVWDGIVIGDNVFVGPNVTFTNDKYPRSKNRNYKQEKIIVKTGASIGANATILPGVTIGKYALVGAGSVVTKDVPDYALYYGNPAKMMGKVKRNGKVLGK